MLEAAFFRLMTVAVLILSTAFFVAAEYAIVSVRETRLEHLSKLGRPGAATALQLKREIGDFLAANQLGVTLCSMALGWLGESALAELLEQVLARSWAMERLPFVADHARYFAHGTATIAAFLLITYFEVLLGEQTPKSMALQRSERIALAVAASFLRGGSALISPAAARGRGGVALAGGVEVDRFGYTAQRPAARLSGTHHPPRY